MKKKIKKIIVSLILLTFPIILAVLLLTSAVYMFKTSLTFSKKKQAVQSEREVDENAAMSGVPSFLTQEMIKGALQSQEDYGYPASVCIAQIIAESGFGTYGPGGMQSQGLSKLAFNYKNLFGIKGTGPAGSINLSTGEQTTSGDSYTITAGFRIYNTYSECIEDRAGILQRVYSDLIDGVTDSDEFARQIGSRWATDGQYGDKLITLMTTYNLYRLDTMTVADYENSSFNIDNGIVTAIQQEIVRIAINDEGTRPCADGYCAAWVSGVYEAAGLGYPGGNAIDFWNRWQTSGSDSKDNIPVGAVVIGSGSGPDGARYGHVGIYIGDGQVVSNVGYLKTETLDSWCSWQSATCQGYQGWIGWVWPNGTALNISDDSASDSE